MLTHFPRLSSSVKGYRLMNNMGAEIDRHCPDCGTPMKTGYLGPVSLIRWFNNYRYLFTMFEIYAGNKVCKSKWLKNQQAYRCLNCGLVVFQGRSIKPWWILNSGMHRIADKLGSGWPFSLWCMIPWATMKDIKRACRQTSGFATVAEASPLFSTAPFISLKKVRGLIRAIFVSPV